MCICVFCFCASTTSAVLVSAFFFVLALVYACWCVHFLLVLVYFSFWCVSDCGAGDCIFCAVCVFVSVFFLCAGTCN